MVEVPATKTGCNIFQYVVACSVVAECSVQSVSANKGEGMFAVGHAADAADSLNIQCMQILLSC